MLAIAQPIYTQKVPAKLQSRKIQKRPTRSVKVQAALPDSDLVNYSLFQLTSWVLPMTIAGRLLKMKYSEIGIGLVALGVAKTALATGNIIHY
tara:strand:- start:2936 stop:3214 length:279 start_codon:yes stop_codon:yes gene_type:complete